MNKEKKPATILIVDDQRSVRELLKALLLQEGYHLISVSNGEEALARMDDIQPDTILLDVMMPGIDGFEVCQRLKAEERWRHIPIILITALDDKKDVSNGLDAGADDFLHKPVNGLELRARVRSMVRLKMQFDALQATLNLREDMTAMIVHDLRSPLTSILGMSELLLYLHNNLSPKQQNYLNTIHSEANRLNSFLNDMLLLTKLEHEQLILNRSTTSINQFMLNIQKRYQPIATSKRLKLVTDLLPTDHHVSLDINLMERVLDNLISNALKFSPKGSIITLKIDSSKHSSQLWLQVLDEGPGVPPEHQASIFDRFSIVDLKNKNVSQIGLGLAFCKLVSEAHGGHIFVTNNTPKGSIFTIVFNLNDVETTIV